MRKKKVLQNKSRKTTDIHHLLFQGRHWKQGYAKMLREHQYFKVRTPKDTLHRELHCKIHDIPTPHGSECKKAYTLLVEGIASGELDPIHDTAEKRLEFLIEVWKDKCPATTAMLGWQRDVFAKFYARRG